MQTNKPETAKKITLRPKKMTEETYNTFHALFMKQYNYSGYVSDDVRNKTIVNKDYLESRGWVLCSYYGHLFPKEEVTKVYTGYENFLKDKVSFICKKATRNVCKDTFLKKDFLQEDIYECYIGDNKYKIVGSHLRYKIDSGEIHKEPARITRNASVYTDFPHYYYDNKKAPKNWKLPSGDTFGIELEVKFPDALSKLRFSGWLKTEFPNWCCERDGSLEDIAGDGNSKDGGLELISPPLNFEDLVEQIKKIIPVMSSHRALGHDTGSELYGLHITHGVVKNGYIQYEQGANFIRLINDPNTLDFWRNVSRRQPNKYCKYIGNYEARIASHALDGFTKSYDTNNHYNSICVREGSTAIETRILRSTINAKTLISSVEMIKLIHEVCGKEPYNAIRYIDYVVKNASPNLTKLLDKTAALMAFNYLKIPNEKYDDANF